ncbi:hypothetical protein [Altericroceibacterium endophyticum]|uniref:Uncharacterized protein n=1 Tax=Altericroceibacterium endophyticum TaxID=1808508 RepID=A0A6I4T4T5_9SPHN|nr:hypothetical protein [Altericroceibacterium endophyticum]MXO65399.1 hypothetical protein [Altericroceibacterium endophyticum]
MSSNYRFYQERADESGKVAETADLANIRDQAKQAQGVWQDMANRARSIEENRTKALAEKESRSHEGD